MKIENQNPKTERGPKPEIRSFFQNPVAASRQSAANLLFSGKKCGVLPRRRYAREILKEPLRISA